MVASLREFGPVWGVDRGFDEVRKGGPWGWLGRWCPGLSRLRVGGWPGWPSRESIASDAEIADTVDGWLGRLGVVGVHHFTGTEVGRVHALEVGEGSHPLVLLHGGGARWVSTPPRSPSFQPITG